MKRLGPALAFCALLSLGGAQAQLAGGLMFPGPGTPHSAGGGGSCPAFKFANTGTNATGTTIIWAVGANTLSAGDLVMLVAIEGDPSSTFATPGTLTPTGFTSLLNTYDGAINGAYATASWKKAVGGETSFTSATASRNIQGEWAMVVYTGANASPIDGNSLALQTTASTTMTAPSISPAGSTDMLFAYASATGGGSSGTGNFSGMTSRVNSGGSGSFTNQTQIYIADTCLSASGATGAKTAGQSNSSAYFGGLVGITP